jgi:gliding motility-associated-like protein
MKHLTRICSILIVLLSLYHNVQGQTANFTADVYSGCDPLVVAFTDKSTGVGSSTTYSWDFGDTKTSTLASPSTTYSGAGTYTVKLTVKNGSGSPSIKTATITVYPSPTVSYTSTPLSGCPCTLVTFTNTSVANAPGAYTSQWSFGDGYTSVTNNTTHTFCTPGSYNIALKVKNSAGCEKTRLDSAKFILFTKPVAGFTATKVNLCKIPDSTTFIGTVSSGKAPYTYDWDFGDSKVGSGNTVAHSYTISGTYTVRLIVTDANGCKDTMTRLNYIKAVPMNSTFKVPATICAGVSLVLFENTSTPTPLKTKWIWSDGGGATGFTSQRNFWSGGTYTITMIDSFGPGCIDTAINTYKVNPKPKANFSYSPIYPCPAPVDITFVNKSVGASTYKWIFGDGTTSAAKDPIHNYKRDSIYTVYLVVTDSLGCSDTTRVRDTTLPFPNGYPKVRGKFSLPTFDSSNSPLIVRVHPGDLSITVDSAAGCFPFFIRPVATMCGYIHLPANLYDDSTRTDRMCGIPPPLPGYTYPPYWPCIYDGDKVDFYPDDVVDPYIIKSTTSCPITPYPYPIVSYYWDFGDGYTSTKDTPSHIYVAEGVYHLSVKVQTHNGCQFTDTILIYVGAHPHAQFIASPLGICIHDSVTITNQSSGGDGYTWNFGDATTFTSKDSTIVFKHRFDLSDSFKVELTASRNGCLDKSRVNIIVRPPQALNVIKYSCDTPMKVTFIDKSKGATSVLWRFGDGFTSTAWNATHIYTAEGNYFVTQIVYNNVYGCSDSIQIPIRIFIPKPNFNTPDTTICLGDTIRFYNTPRDYFGDWIWKTADSTQANISTGFTTQYHDTGSYSVMFVGFDIHGCYDTSIRNHYVIVAKPQMKISASPLIACTPASIKFIDSSTNTKGAVNVSRTWYWGDLTSTTDTAKTATKVYTSPGNYTVKLITTDNIGCRDSIQLMVESRKPIADFAALLDTFTCIGKINQFYNAATGFGLKYYWDFGDGGKSTDPNPQHIYTTLGSFNVTLVVVDDQGCKDSLTKIAFVKTTKPTASFTMSDTLALCPPLFVNYTNTSTNAIGYYWDLGNGSTAIISSPVAAYVDSGVYKVFLVAYDSHGCTDTAKAKARVMGYDGAFKYAPLNGCAPLTVNFEADLFNATVMIWDFADGYTESAVGKLKTSHTYTKPGAYLPRMILGDGKGCATMSKGLDTIKVDGVFPVVYTTPACEGAWITFTDTSYSPFSKYASSWWKFDDGTTSTSKKTIHKYPTAGTYPIRLVSTNTHGCVDTLDTTIVVYPLPKVHVNDTVICLGDQAVLQASGAATYLWNADLSLSCTDCPAPKTNTRVPITYYVQGTDVHGCVNKDTVKVGIKTKTTLVLAKDTDACAQTPIQLHASGATNYAWTPITGLDSPSIAHPIAKLDSNIIYRVIGTEGSCIPDTAFVKVTIHPLPEVNAGPDQRVLAGTLTQLNGTSKVSSAFLWIPSDSLSCATCANPTVRLIHTSTFTLTGITSFGCTDTDDVEIVIFCDQSQLFIPNTFTPNGDGHNDYFYPQGKGVGKIKSFIVYNRWGQKVFERTNIDANTKELGWDGTFKGEPQGSDTFVYTLEATCDNGETVFWKGDVTLIK